MTDRRVLNISGTGFSVVLLDSKKIDLINNRPSVSWLLSRRAGLATVEYGQIVTNSDVPRLSEDLTYTPQVTAFLKATLIEHYRKLGVVIDIEIMQIFMPMLFDITKDGDRQEALFRRMMDGIATKGRVYNLSDGYTLEPRVDLKSPFSHLSLDVTITRAGENCGVGFRLDSCIFDVTIPRWMTRRELKHHTEYIFNVINPYVALERVDIKGMCSETNKMEVEVYVRRGRRD